jgi:stage V sporulation protein R
MNVIVKPEDRLLYQGADWDFDTLMRIHDACEEIAGKELGLSWYPNRIEVISAEQMLDAYASTGLPLFYRHWSFGKHFAQHEALYRKGLRGLAYEIVINSDPCVSYVMEENTTTLQALVIAHAAFGHNHFFKNNELFRQWTDAKGILDYLEFAKAYVQSCEEQHGEAAVERVLDSAHALMNYGVHRHRRRAPDLMSEQKRERERREHDEQMFNVLWSTLPEKASAPAAKGEEERRRTLLQLPQENVLYFLEKSAPRLAPWQREILRIVRNVAQYFYPQRQTKMMNEGCATYTHHRILGRLHEQGRISDTFVSHHAAGLRRPALFRDEPLCARLRHDGGYRAHLPRADGRGPRVVPRLRRLRRPDAGAAAWLGRIPRRELHPAIPQPEPDAEDEVLPPEGRRGAARAAGRRHA